MKIYRNTKGSIALISILVIAAFVLILGVGMAENSISMGYQHVNNASSMLLNNFAEGCFEEALHRIEGDAGYTGSTVTLDGSTCVISVTGESPKIANITTTYLDYTQNFQGTVDVVIQGHAINASLSDWSEI